MEAPALPLESAEARRLASLRSLKLSEAAAGPPFDDLVRAAAALCSAPMAMLTVVDHEQVWCLASLGLEDTAAVPRGRSFSAWAIDGPSLFQVQDTSLDPRFEELPVVAGPDGARFFAGMPVAVEPGLHVAVLAVLDRTPRQLSAAQHEGLAALARATAAALGQSRQLQVALMGRQLANIVHHSDDAVVGKTLDNVIMSWNEGAERLFGYRADEVIGRPVSILYPPERAGESDMLAAQVRAGATVRQLDTVRRHKDGHLLEVQVTLSPIRDTDGEVIGVAKIARDIADRKASERALARSEARYRALIEDQSELVSLSTPDGMLTFVNAAYARHFGRTRDQMIGTSLFDYIPEPEHASVRAHLRQVCESRKQSVGENHMLSADGGRHWLSWTNLALVDDADRVIAIHSVGRDVTDRHAMEQALQAARVDLQAVMDHSPIMVSAWNMDWTNRFANLAYARWWNTTPEALYGRHVRDVIGEAAYARSQGAIQDVHLGRAHSFERTVPGLDGRLRHVLVEYVPDMREGEPSGAFVFVTDVTERMQDRQEIARQNELLKVTLASIGEGVITCDAEGRVAWMNAVAERLTGWAAAEARGMAMARVFPVLHAGSREPAGDVVTRCLALGTPVALDPDSVLVSRDGNEYGVENSAAPIRSKDGEILGAVLVFRDVSEQRRLAGEMRYRAAHDSLTGVYNRSEFDLRLADLLSRVRLRGGVHALLFVDLDRFKLVNDSGGHEAGDRMLRQVARLLGEGIRSRDVLARMGGDEFAILLEDCSPAQARRIAEAILERLAGHRFEQDGNSFEIGASIGMVTVDGDAPAAPVLLRRADQACYDAKAAGRNRVETWRGEDASAA